MRDKLSLFVGEHKQLPDISALSPCRKGRAMLEPGRAKSNSNQTQEALSFEEIFYNKFW